MKKNVYIIGSKGIPANYGGFETFVEKLTEYNQNSNIKYHIACMKENSEKSGIVDDHFVYNGAFCFNIDVPSIGPARAIYYDLKALDYSIELAKKNNDRSPVFYVLACRIGPFIGLYKKKIKKIGGKLYVNPDGHEWLRQKWSYPVRKYWKISERLMVKHSDLLICDSVSIKEYIERDYKNYIPETAYIAYGTDLYRSQLLSNDLKVTEWYKKNEISENNYYLVVGRFVPENNYEAMIRGFMSSETKKDFVLITNIENNKFYRTLLEKTKLNEDNRIKFVGTVYDQELLKYIRENAFANIHGHEVGGTNPSLLEAMYSTKLNLLLDVNFNREVGGQSAVYWQKNNLDKVISIAEKKDNDFYESMNILSTNRIKSNFSWEKIVDDYETLFISK